MLALAAGTLQPLWARAQVKPTAVEIGFLHFGSRAASGHLLSAFRQGMAAAGWKEGQVVIVDRWANGDLDRMHRLAEELASKKPALIVATSAQTVKAAAKVAPTTPIVQATGTDPVAAGFAQSLARPGGMITGLSNLHVDVTEKLLDLLLSAVPKLRRVGFLMDENNVNHALYMKSAQRAVKQYALEGHYSSAARVEQLPPAIERLAKERIDGVVVLGGVLFGAENRRIVELTLARRWPAISTLPAFADQGGLLSYGVDVAANYRRAAHYVDRILKGAKPGDLPIEQPTTIQLVVNRKTAKAFGLTVPQDLILRADRVIE